MIPQVAIGPDRAAAEHLAVAVRDAGGRIVEADRADALIWTAWNDPVGLASVLRSAPRIRWVQLTTAGVDAMSSLFDDGRIWTSAKGCYSQPIAEYVVGAALVARRHVLRFARARSWGVPAGATLEAARVTIIGGGGIATATVGMLAPFGAEIEVVRRRVGPMPGAQSVVGADALDESLGRADIVVCALALTPETDGLIGAPQLAAMQPHTWIINVARGRHIVTNDLVEALRHRRIGGAVLDVTDPEPLPDTHPLWRLDNCLITPHTACTLEMGAPLLARRIGDNVVRWGAGQPLIGIVDVLAGF